MTPLGATHRWGDVFVMMVCGFHKPPAEWGSLPDAEEKNAGSIVIRLQYRDRSILFAGDAVGRLRGDDPNVCIATEKFMVDNADIIPINSNIVIAPHHGGDNGSSKVFIQAVDPNYVVFSAGHKHQHPTAAAAQRYLDYGVPIQNMFRTDRGDDESEPGEEDLEWTNERVNGNHDPTRGDDIDIIIHEDGSISVGYRPP